MLEENFPASLLNKLLVTWHFHYFITICTSDSKVLTVKEHPRLELASHFYVLVSTRWLEIRVTSVQCTKIYLKVFVPIPSIKY